MDCRVGLTQLFNKVIKDPFPLIFLLSGVRVMSREVSYCGSKRSATLPSAPSILLCSEEEDKGHFPKVFHNMGKASFPETPSWCLLPCPELCLLHALEKGLS